MSTCRKNLLATLALALGLAGLTALPAAAQPVDFQELVSLVDLKIPGWELESKPEGMTMKRPEVQMSQAAAKFRSGSQTMDILIMDFPGKASPIPRLGDKPMELDTGEMQIRTVTIQGCPGTELYRTRDKFGDLNIVVAGRFWVKLTGTGIDGPEVLRAAAQQMDLKKLASLAK